MASSPLNIQSRRDDHRVTLSLGGELDIASSPTLEAKAKELFSEGMKQLVLDLRGLEFIDSSGLNAILRLRAKCEEHLCEFALMPGERPVQRLFEVTRLIDRLPFRRGRHGHDAVTDPDIGERETAGGEPGEGVRAERSDPRG
jgi:anti-sigma B factor antagonist